MKKTKSWQVYILASGDGRLYTGITNDLARRLRQHKAGTGARFTRSFGVAALLHTERRATRSAALKREAAIKALPRNGKLALIKGRAPRKRPPKPVAH
jgi:predicted GIY-YIG superfamily endonuclease